MRPKYVIISEYDAPRSFMVCQWVGGIGYCYLDRSNPVKKAFDGLGGSHATSVRAFGWEWAEDTDGYVRFYRTDAPPSATYSDLEPRPWQGGESFFEFPMLRRIGSRAYPLGLVTLTDR